MRNWSHSSKRLELCERKPSASTSATGKHISGPRAHKRENNGDARIPGALDFLKLALLVFSLLSICPIDLLEPRRIIRNKGAHKSDMSEEDRQAMEVALRVLMAFATTGRDPDPADVERLRQLEPRKATLPIDELAREVIERRTSRLEHGQSLERSAALA